MANTRARAKQVTYKSDAVGGAVRNLHDKLSETVSVKDFGAVGDGVTDDTAAIQAALDYQSASATTATAGTGEVAGTAPTVFFPKGVYITSATLNWNEEYGIIYGEQAVLKKAAVFTGTTCLQNAGSAFRVDIEGIQFIDYAKGLYLDSSNTNSGRVNITNCSFIGCTDYGLHLDTQSSIVNITNSIFRSNVHDIWIETCDSTSINGGWFQREGDQLTVAYDAAIIAEGNKLIMNDCVMVPQPETLATEPAWIKTSKDFYANNVRFGDESGGITAINCFSVGDNTIAGVKRSIVLKDCSPTATGTSTPTIRLFELPNIIVIKDSSGFGQSNGTLIDWSSSVSGGDQTTKINTARASAYYGWLYYIELTNVANRGVPSNLAEFTRGLRGDRYSSAGGNINMRYEYNGGTIPPGDYYFKQSAVGYDISGNADGVRGELEARATGNAGALDWVFRTAPDASTSLNDVIRVTSRGTLRFIPLSSDPSGAIAGDVYYNSTTNKLRCYNGTIWNDLF